MNTKFNIGDDVNVISDGKIPHLLNLILGRLENSLSTVRV
jgi:hypothetical protein